MTYIKNINGKWYAFEGNIERNQVYSIGADDPKDGGQWCANWCDSGIEYVASPSPTRKAAYQKASRHGIYGGELK